MNAVEITKKLVSIESTDPGQYEIEVEKYLHSLLCELKEYGVEVFESEVLDGRKNLMGVFAATNQNSNENLNQNSNQNSKNQNSTNQNSELVFICHMDTVVVGDGWNKNPFEAHEENRKIYGRGACDMKSGCAVALSAFACAVQKYKKENIKRTLKIIFTVDEEANMKGVEKVIEDGWVNKNSFVLDFEPTDGALQVSHKGRLWIELDITGKTAHASMPQEGIDANIVLSSIIYSLNKKIAQLEEDDELGKTTMTIGLMSGGYQPYVVPDKASATLDIRLTPPTDKETILSLLYDATRDTMAELNLATKITSINKVQQADAVNINSIVSYKITGDRAYVKRDDSSEFIKIFVDTLKSLNLNSNIEYFSGYTDTAVIASTLKNINCASYGPGSLALAHKPDEYVDIADIERCVQVATDLISRTIL